MTNYGTLLYEGRDAWNRAREADRATRPDLSGISLSRKHEPIFDLAHHDFSGLVLRNASNKGLHLSYSSLSGADCRGSQFSGVSFEECDLTDADFRYTRLYNCYLTRANLTRTDFAGALFRDVQVRGAIVDGTNFGNIDLSRTHDLDGLEHRGPAVIGVGALRESHGRVPRTFLEKAGVPEDIVRVAMRWAREPVRYHKCFISYASEDGRFVSQLRDRLRRQRRRPDLFCRRKPHAG
jgi:uncharacterized protein YjbI with pentapeptide repeats